MRHQHPDGLHPESLHNPHLPTPLNSRSLLSIILLCLLQVMDPVKFLDDVDFAIRRHWIHALDVLEAQVLPD